MTTLQDIYDFIFDDDVEHKFDFGHPYAPPLLIVFYIIFCKWIGPAAMRNRKPFNLRNVIIAYNFFQMFVNSYAVYGLIKYLIDAWSWRCCKDTSPLYPISVKTGRLLTWHIYLIKYVDLIDAVFFVLRKKNSQITFLHIFHHAAVCFFAYIMVRLSDFGYYLVLGVTMNCAIHVVMYLYYALAAFGEHMQKYLWWKKYLTLMQIIQFIGVLVYMAVSFASGCEKLGKLEISSFSFIVALLILFLNFYRKSFKKE